MKFFSIIYLSLFALNLQAQYWAKESLLLMGCAFEITASHQDSLLAEQAVAAGIAEIQRIEAVISSWKEDSETSEVVRQAGIKPVKVSAELYNLVQRSLKISKLTNGAFDITFAGVHKLWNFNGEEHIPVSISTLDSMVGLIGYENVILNPADTSIYLKIKGMRMGFGAIGKGYAANRARQIMQRQYNILNGVVNASGDLVAWGKSKSKDFWEVKIADPDKKKPFILSLPINNQSVVTSGSYEKFLLINGQRHAHIIDPRTGYPTAGIKSVTVISPDAEISDALATSIFVMGVENGLNLINQMNGIECLIIDDNNTLHSSNNLKIQ